MAPLLKQLGKPTSTFIQKQDWMKSVLYLGGVNSVSDLNSTKTPDTHDDFYATSTFVSQKEPLNAAAADALMKYFYTTGKTSKVQWFIIL